MTWMQAKIKGNGQSKAIFRKLNEDRFLFVSWSVSGDQRVRQYKTEEVSALFESVRNEDGKVLLASSSDAAKADRIVSRYYGS